MNEGTNIQQTVNTEQEEKIQEEAPVIEKENAVTETKDEYNLKLNTIEESLTDLHDLYDEENTVSMKAAAEGTYKRWDAALNEIYSALKEQLSTSEIANLRCMIIGKLK